MSQNDFTIANQGFPSFRSDLNSALQALASNSSGSTEPTTTFAYQWWYDTTTNILKLRNADDDAWISVAEFDQSNDISLLVKFTDQNGSAILPTGTTAQRDVSPSAGYIRFNTTDTAFEGYDGSSWNPVGGGGKWYGENGSFGKAGDIFRSHEDTLNTDVTIPSGENAYAAGPLTVASGVTLTVNGNLVIL